MKTIKFLYLIILFFYINYCFSKNLEQLFSPLPLNSLIHVSEKVKPNIIALIDNSNFTSKSELTKLMDTIFSDKDIINNQNWGIAYLYNQKEPFFNIDINLSLSSTSDITIKIVGMVLGTTIPVPVIGNLTGILTSDIISKITSNIIPNNIKIPINSQLFTKEISVNALNKTSHLDKIKSSIKNYHALGPTSITKKYYNLTKEIRYGDKETTFGSTIQYSCQPNYIVILTNGINYNSLKTNSILAFINGFSKTDNTEFEDKSTFLQEIIASIPTISSIPNIISILTSIIKLIPKINTSKVVINDDDDFVKKYIFNLNGQYIDFEKWNNSNENQYGSYGLSFLSENHSNNEITEKYSVYNKNDSTFLPKQTIDTIIIGVNTNNENKDYSYLENGSSYIYGFGNRAFFKVLNIKQFKNLINTPFFPSNQKKYLTSNPLMINLNNKRLVVLAEENPINWSTILYFKELNKNKNDMSLNLDKFYNNSYTAEFGNLTNNLYSRGSSRRFIVSTGRSEPKFLDNETYNNWLMRISNKSDKDLMLRNRCLEKICAISNPQRMMGDIGNNNILYIEDKTKKNSSFIVTAANDGMIHIFKNIYNNKFQLILNYVPGSLLKNSQTLWDIIPITAKKNYGIGPNNTHQFLLNGSMSYYGITKKNCSFNICSKSPAELIIIGSAGKGAKGIYALNIAGKDFNNNNELGLSSESQKAWLQDIPLWESSSKYFGYNKNDPSNYQESLKLGFVIGSPKIAPITIKRYLDKNIGQYKPDLKSGKYYATFVNNGIFNEDGIPTLYIFDAIGIKSTEIINNDGYIYVTNEKKINNAGKIIKKIKVPNDIKFSDRQGLSPVTLVDTDNDEIADIAYAGDYEGNMYRFDFRKSNIDDWSVTRIYKGAGLDENLIPIQPITTAPTVYKKDESGYHYVVIFGTGSNLFLDDIKELYEKYNNKKYPNAKFQSIYGIYDDLNENNNTEYSKRYQQLVEQKIILSSNKILNNNKNIRKLENNTIRDDKKGWFIDLNNQTYNNNESYSEEKIINDPKVFGKSVFFTTEFYKILNSNKECSQYISTGYGGWIMGVNAINGGNLNDNTINFDTKNPNERISGVMLDEKLSPISFTNHKENFNLNKDGQFQNGWEEYSLIPSKKYDEGSLFIYDSNNLILLSNKKNNYIKYRRISWREIF